jgi:hypothetical protein
LLGACGDKKELLANNQPCQSNEQCASGNCAAQGAGRVCQASSGNKVCAPGATQACTCTDGKTGSQACNNDGLSWGVCICQGGGHACTPGQTQACTCTDGKTGSQACNTDGQSWAACQCQGGGTNCFPGQTQACTCGNGQSGSQACNADGKSWAACQCQGGNACTPGSTQACTCTNGQGGSQTCNANGQSWSACQCQGGNACTPGQTQACTCANGQSGSQTCAANGQSWAACQCQGGTGKKIGESCAQNTDCAGSFCIEKSGGNPYCSQKCTSTDCPSGYACTNYDENTQVCGRIRPNAKPVGSPCQSLLDCQTLICWRGVCAQRCEVTACPGGLKCVSYHQTMRFCSAGVCEPANVSKANDCAKACTTSECSSQCLGQHTSTDCQNCYIQLAQCATNSGCNASQPTCCAAIQKQCFGGI